MPLVSESIVSNAMGKLKDKGFKIDDEHSKQNIMVEAIVEAIIEDILLNGLVVVTTGSSSGNYKIT
jgi:predicted transcriptional regulator